MLTPILDFCFPPRCFGCADYLLPNERASRVCRACVDAVFAVESPMCPRCALPRDSPAGVDAHCRYCLASPPAFDRAFARFVYQGAVSDAVRRAKGSANPAPLLNLGAAAQPWFDAMAGAFAGWTWTTPPTHPVDLRRRGWDPARTLARAVLARNVALRFPLRSEHCATKQARLGRVERHAAKRDAFQTSGEVSGPWVVLDDVMTTGATLGAAARALKLAGATAVVGVVLCRAV